MLPFSLNRGDSMANDEFMLTTIDNPCNPFDDFDGWLDFDRRHGYFTQEYLARICDETGVSSGDLGEKVEEHDILNVIDDICKLNVRGIYKKIRPGEDPKPVDIVYDE